MTHGVQGHISRSNFVDNTVHKSDPVRSHKPDRTEQREWLCRQVKHEKTPNLYPKNDGAFAIYFDPSSDYKPSRVVTFANIVDNKPYVLWLVTSNKIDFKQLAFSDNLSDFLLLKEKYIQLNPIFGAFLTDERPIDLLYENIKLKTKDLSVDDVVELVKQIAMETIGSVFENIIPDFFEEVDKDIKEISIAIRFV